MEYSHCCEGWKSHVLAGGSVLLSVFVCVSVCASSHYLLLPAPGDSAPSLHLSSWLATICLSTSSSLVSRSNWSSCTQTQERRHGNERRECILRDSFTFSYWQIWSQHEGGRLTVWQLKPTVLCFMVACRIMMTQNRSIWHSKQANSKQRCLLTQVA